MLENKFHIFESFAQIAKAYPEKKAVIFKRNASDSAYKYLTYAQVYDNSVQLGNLLKDKGIEPNDKLTIVLDTRPEYAIAFFSAMYAEAVAVPLDIQLPAGQITQFILHSESKLLITTEKIYSGLKNYLQDLTAILIDSAEFQAQINKYPSDTTFTPKTETDKELLALLVYTSGTTDLPKAVMLTQANLLSNVNAIKKSNIVTEGDIIVSILPLHHTYPFMVTLLLPLSLGASISYPLGLSSGEILNCIKETQATILVGVPQIYSALHRAIKEKIKKLPLVKQVLANFLGELFYVLRLSFNINLNKRIFSEIHKTIGESLRFMASGGARLDPDVAEDFFKWGFTILEGYGLTETSPVVTFNLIDSPKIGSVGKPIPQVELKIVNPNQEGIGEVAIKGPNVMAGYYNMPRQTKEAVKDGWFSSGDLGYLDNEGYLYLTGRKKEIIVLSNGKNINPEEIEKAYSQSPFIKEICVLPIKASGLLKGVESLAAIIVIDEEYFKLKNEINIRNRLKWELDTLSIKLPSYKRISGFVISKDSLPRTRLGKIMRHKIQELYAEQLESNKHKEEEPLKKEDLDILSLASTQQVLSLLKQALNKEVSINDHLELDLGLDSLGRIELLLGLQTALGLEVSDEQAMDFFMSLTVKDLIEKFRRVMPDIKKQPQKEKAFLWSKIINDGPSNKTLKKISLKPNIFALIIGLIIISIFKAIFYILFLLKVEGKHNLKEKGAYLICPNHTSYLDGLIVLSALPFKTALNTYFVGLSVIFEHFILKGLIKTARLIPLEINLNLTEALQTCSFVLRNSKIVCYFAEGQRSVDGEIKDFKKGVGILIKELAVPVIPAYIEGSFRAWPRGKSFPRLSPLKITFGKMVNPDELLPAGVSNEEESYEMIARNLQQKVASLRDNKTFKKFYIK
mgnify:FL=1